MEVKGRLIGRGKERETGERGNKKVTEEVNVIKVHYVHVWKGHDKFSTHKKKMKKRKDKIFFIHK
jgi:hypothetical protein